jgi:hypothetical protein
MQSMQHTSNHNTAALHAFPSNPGKHHFSIATLLQALYGYLGNQLHCQSAHSQGLLVQSDEPWV